LSARIPIRLPQSNISFLNLLLHPCVPQQQEYTLRFRKIIWEIRGLPLFYGMVSTIYRTQGTIDCGGVLQ
jgi:hypothetical protein